MACTPFGSWGSKWLEEQAVFQCLIMLFSIRSAGPPNCSQPNFLDLNPLQTLGVRTLYSNEFKWLQNHTEPRIRVYIWCAIKAQTQINNEMYISHPPSSHSNLYRTFLAPKQHTPRPRRAHSVAQAAKPGGHQGVRKAVGEKKTSIICFVWS